MEIGTHHGKSLVSMLAGSDEASIAYVIDLFERQEENRDRSGRGDLARMKSNLEAFGIAEDRVVVDPRSSFEVTSDDIVSRVGRARLFHIDGGHHLDVVDNDLELAIESLEAAGVLAIDDVFRSEWPEVSMAVFGSTAIRRSGFRVFAIGFNKTYWCRPEHAEGYRAALRANRLLESSLRKTCVVDESPVLVFRRDPLPEWRLAWLLGYVLELRFPPGVRRSPAIRSWHPVAAPPERRVTSVGTGIPTPVVTAASHGPGRNPRDALRRRPGITVRHDRTRSAS